MAALQAGSQIGSYVILAPIGAGGMGEVYRSRDTKLKREVAIKVLPAEFSRDPERLRRFRREAELLATLNHPHVAQIYGLEELPSTGAEHGMRRSASCWNSSRARPSAIVSPTGRCRSTSRWRSLARLPRRWKRRTSQGIVHRDLKPGNIKITRRRAREGARLRPGEADRSPTRRTRACRSHPR